MNVAEAVRVLREDSRYADLIRDSYLGEDVQEAAERFRTSAEFAEVLDLAGSCLTGGRVLESGLGMASPPTHLPSLE